MLIKRVQPEREITEECQVETDIAKIPEQVIAKARRQEIPRIDRHLALQEVACSEQDKISCG